MKYRKNILGSGPASLPGSGVAGAAFNLVLMY